MADKPVRAEFLLQLTSCQSALYAAITALLGGVEGAQDILQETNVVLLEKAGEYDSARPFVPWALAFARFQVMAWRKRQSRDRLVLNDELFAVLADRLAAESISPNRRLDAIESCLGKLQPDSRQLVDARYKHGEPVQEIASRLGRSVNVVSVSLFRIRKALLDCVRATLAAEGGLLMDARAEFEQLLADLVDNPPDADRNQRLDALLRAHPELQGEYLDYLQLHALLQWRGGQVVPQEKAELATPADRPSRTVRRRSLRGLAVALAALAACIALVFFLRPPEAQATPDLVVRLIDWNLDLTQARSRDERTRIYDEQADRLKSSLAQTELPAADRELAETLIENSSWLAQNVDPMAEADRFNDIADKLVARIDLATNANDEKRIVQLADTYGRLKEVGVDANVELALASGAVGAKKMHKLTTVCNANRSTKLAEIMDRNPGAPRKAIRRAMKGHFHKGKKYHKPADY